MTKCIVYNDKMWDNLEPILHFTTEHLSPTDEVSERVVSAGKEQRKDESTYRRQFGRPDPQVQEEVGTRNDVITNSTKICDFLKISGYVLEDPIVVRAQGCQCVASVLTRIYTPKGTNNIS